MPSSAGCSHLLQGLTPHCWSPFAPPSGRPRTQMLGLCALCWEDTFCPAPGRGEVISQAKPVLPLPHRPQHSPPVPLPCTGSGEEVSSQLTVSSKLEEHMADSPSCLAEGSQSLGVGVVQTTSDPLRC